MNRPLADRVVLICGASRGLGAATAVAAARAGARVALLARSTDALNHVAAAVREQGALAIECPADVRDADQAQGAVDKIVTAWGRLDVLVNAVAVKPVGPLEDASPQDLLDAFTVNCLGPYLCIRAVLPVMRRQGAGHVINVSSVLGKRATPLRGAYSASKAALNALTDALRVELSGSGVCVTLVCPGRLTDPSAGSTDDDARFAMSTTRAAEHTVRCIARPRREIVLTWAARGLVCLNTLTPQLVDRLLGRARRRGTHPDKDA